MTDTLVLILSGLGIGGILGVFLKSLLDKQHHKFSKVFEYKEARYKAIMILMWVSLNPTEYELGQLRKHRPDIKSIEELDRELYFEYHNAMLFASDKVLAAFNIFLHKKDISTWKLIVRAMKRDLYL